jgi:hypothetical protein
MSYRSPVDGFRTCYRCGADLADGASFCPDCGATQRLSAGPRRQATRQERRPAWLPFAIIGGGIAAIAAGALLAVILGGDQDGVATDPSASASVLPSVSGSSSATPAESASPTPSPTPEGAPVIPNLGIAAVTTDGLNIRSGPSDGAEVLGDLARDQRLFVIGEPSEADDFRWYRVATLTDRLIGYVATPIEAGDPWIEQEEIDCPISPMTAESLGALHPLEALHCFGNGEIVVTGTVDPPCCPSDSPYVFTPEWLGPQIAVYLNAGAGNHIPFRGHPDSDLEAPSPGAVVRVTGHHEDPAATTCRATLDPEAPGESEPPNPALVILDCRSTFVWTDYE